MWPLYHAGMYLFMLGIRLSSIWNDKSGLWIRGRKNWKEKIGSLPVKRDFRIWFHVSSLGEFEQAKAVIEKIKHGRPSTEIILSFFSPSGFTIRESYALATAVLYLPPDLPGNAPFWLSRINPDLAVFVKYDLWPGFLRELKNRNIPAILIAANWEPGRKFSSWNTPWTKELLRGFDRIYFQSRNHIDFFRDLGFSNLDVAGDTRVDRSLKLPVESFEKIPEWIRNAGPFDLVAGSTWPEDEHLVLAAISALNLKAIIAPHDVSAANITRLRNKIGGNVQLLSDIERMDRQASIILVDSIGLLSSLYAHGGIAYVGGGFGKGIHNILEPMAHSKPVIFGPRYKRFPEAEAAISVGAGFTIHTKEELIETISFLNQSDNARQRGMKSREYLEKHAGASGIISNYILESIPFGGK